MFWGKMASDVDPARQHSAFKTDGEIAAILDSCCLLLILLLFLLLLLLLLLLVFFNTVIVVVIIVGISLEVSSK